MTTSLIKKHDERFEKMRFQAKRSAFKVKVKDDSKSRMREILFLKKKVDLSIVDDNIIYNIIIFQAKMCLGKLYEYVLN